MDITRLPMQPQSYRLIVAVDRRPTHWNMLRNSEHLGVIAAMFDVVGCLPHLPQIFTVR